MKIDRMHERFGVCEGHVCKECPHFVVFQNHRPLRKCRAYGVTSSAASDWAGCWTACGLFGEPYSGRPIIEVRPPKQKETAAQLDGQITFAFDVEGEATAQEETEEEFDR